MGMNSDEFWDLTPREFHFKMDGFYEKEMLTERLAWERTRWATCWMVNVHGDGKKLIKPSDLITFDWDKEELKVEPISKKDLERIKKLYDGR